MKQKHYIILIGCLLSISVALLALYASSPLSGGIYRASFDRNFIKTPVLSLKAVMDVKYNSFYIAGITDNKIYLGNTSVPFLMGTTDISLKRLTPIRLNITGLDSIKNIERFRLSVDSPYFYLFHGTMPQILRGSIESKEARPIMTDSEYYFSEAVPISPSSFAMRSHNMKEQSYELAKKTIDAPYFNFKNDLLQKQIDGIFCLDGQLHYNKDLKRVVYHHFYRNELVVSDSNLNLMYRTHTIDTFSKATVKVATIGSGGETMLTGGSIQVNARGCVFRKYLFVNSNLLARNEDKKMFFSGIVIDVYNLTDGTYMNSFYIPYYQNKRPTDFRFFEDHMIAVYDQYLVLYDFNFTYPANPL